LKELLRFDKAIGGDGAKAVGAIVVEAGELKAEVSLSYPVSKIIEPVTKVLDSALDKLETIIPGDWDKKLIDQLKKEYREELDKLIIGV